jgi:DUF4097 and DUF4098 domain-containing protein YvlB
MMGNDIPTAAQSAKRIASLIDQVEGFLNEWIAEAQQVIQPQTCLDSELSDERKVFEIEKSDWCKAKKRSEKQFQEKSKWLIHAWERLEIAEKDFADRLQSNAETTVGPEAAASSDGEQQTCSASASPFKTKNNDSGYLRHTTEVGNASCREQSLDSVKQHSTREQANRDFERLRKEIRSQRTLNPKHS